MPSKRKGQGGQGKHTHEDDSEDAGPGFGELGSMLTDLERTTSLAMLTDMGTATAAPPAQSSAAPPPIAARQPTSPESPPGIDTGSASLLGVMSNLDSLQRTLTLSSGRVELGAPWRAPETKVRGSSGGSRVSRGFLVEALIIVAVILVVTVSYFALDHGPGGAPAAPDGTQGSGMGAAARSGGVLIRISSDDNGGGERGSASSNDDVRGGGSDDDVSGGGPDDDVNGSGSEGGSSSLASGDEGIDSPSDPLKGSGEGGSGEGDASNNLGDASSAGADVSGVTPLTSAKADKYDEHSDGYGDKEEGEEGGDGDGAGTGGAKGGGAAIGDWVEEWKHVGQPAPAGADSAHPAPPPGKPVSLTALKPAPTAGQAVIEKLVARLMPPGCTRWKLDPAAMLLRSDDPNYYIRITSFSERKFSRQVELVSPWEALRLGYNGLVLGKDWAGDFWFRNTFRDERPYMLLTAHEPLTGGNVRGNGETWELTHGVGVDADTGTLVVFRYTDQVVFDSGFRIRELSTLWWHRLTIVASSGVQVYFINGTRVGATAVPGFMTTLQVLGNGGIKERYLQFPWGIMQDVQFCVNPGGGGPLAQVRAERARMAHIRTRLAEVMTWESNWVSLMAEGSVAVVGNSRSAASHLHPPSLHKAVDNHKFVIRFNAFQAATKDVEHHEQKLQQHAFGSKVTHDVLADLTHLCGCRSGSCCGQVHAYRLLQRHSKHSGVMILNAQRHHPSPRFRKVLSEGKVTWHYMHPQEHFEDAFNVWLDDASRAHPELTHRVPPLYVFRTGFRILAHLLMHGMRPDIVGFDMGEHALLAQATGLKVRDLLLAQHVVEERVLLDLRKSGLVKELHGTAKELHALSKLAIPGQPKPGSHHKGGGSSGSHHNAGSHGKGGSSPRTVTSHQKGII
eukprot:jgi/Mesvir1/10709/Mv13795-RA.1